MFELHLQMKNTILTADEPEEESAVQLPSAAGRKRQCLLICLFFAILQVRRAEISVFLPFFRVAETRLRLYTEKNLSRKGSYASYCRPSMRQGETLDPARPCHAVASVSGRCVREVTSFIAAEALRGVELESYPVKTPLAETTGYRIANAIRLRSDPARRSRHARGGAESRSGLGRRDSSVSSATM